MWAKLAGVAKKGLQAYQAGKTAKDALSSNKDGGESVINFKLILIAPLITIVLLVLAPFMDKNTGFMEMQGADSTAYANSSNTSNKSNSASAVVNEARGALGVPYVWGGESYTDGMDCSGLVVVCYRRALSVEVPHQTGQIFNSDLFEKVDSVDKLSPGDLIQFGGSGGSGHVGIYTGEGTVIEEPGWNVPGSGNVCVETDLDKFLTSSSHEGPYFLHYVG